MAVEETLGKYLLERQVKFPKPMIPLEEIVNDPEKLERVGGFIKNNREELTLIIEARLEALREELLMEAIPYEVMELRRAIMEIATLLSDFQSYETALEAKKKQDDKKAEDEANGVKTEGESDNSQSEQSL